MNYQCDKCKGIIFATTEEEHRGIMIPGERKFEWVFICNTCKQKDKDMSGNPGKAVGAGGISIGEFMQAKMKIAKMQPVYDLAMNFIKAHVEHEKNKNDPNKNRATGRAAYNAEQELIEQLSKHLDEQAKRV